MLKKNKETPKSSPYVTPQKQKEMRNDYQFVAEAVLQLLREDFCYVNSELKRYGVRMELLRQFLLFSEL
jgi:hypothetical protein